MKRTEFTQPWLDALRSGKLEQSRGMYTNNGRYCCLAVGLKFAVKSDKWGDLEDKLGVYAKGSGSITDQVDNVISVFQVPEEGKDRDAPDHCFTFSKQRNAVSGWEGKNPTWFDKDSLQFLGKRGEKSKVYIAESN